MRLFAVSAAALLLSGAASAAPRPAAPSAPPPPPSVPRLLAQAGYSTPAVPPSACRAVNAGQATCTLPPMTAGRYFARATAASTATAEGAAQQITIVAGDQHCTSTYAPDPKAPWSVGVRRAFTAGCVFTIVSDAPITVTAVYLDEKATKDPAGPSLAMYPQAWSGALNAVPVEIKQ